MTVLLTTAVVLLLPFLAISALLVLAERLQDRRERARYRQIALTDAIHRELGAVAAPTVRQRLGGGWAVSMAVPLDRPAAVAAILRVTGQHFSPQEQEAVPLEIILTPETSSVWPRAAHPMAPPRGTAGTPLAA
ncbi:MAG TPA: hypothetical protein VNU02_13265 [Candidatus Dormibacteraeota bacterium]|jgi:hypothetical protein|nr:hypothetical protein [Candidatus Dormibacteraeota bacterium]